jgi:pimeloyl-ACP methyl ester carboxylesterase
MQVTRRVRASDGIDLALTESGVPGAPTVICVHGYPDNSSVWNAVAAELADRYRVVTYDVRGFGESGRPTERAGYRLDQLAEDLRSVADAVSPDRPVHLIGHDWGSIQGWHAVTAEHLAGRIASYTSISGPCLDHAAAWVRSALRGGGAKPQHVARQLLESSYILLFTLPLIPESLWRNGFLDRALAARAMSAREAAAVPPAATPLSDKINGLQLYRANMLGRLARPRPRRTGIPVQVLAPARDPFVRPELQLNAPVPWVSDLRTSTIPGGHWVIVTEPAVVARHASELIEYAEGRTGSPPG